MVKKPNEYPTSDGRIAFYTGNLTKRESGTMAGKETTVSYKSMEQLADIQSMYNGFEMVNSRKNIQIFDDAKHKVMMANKELLAPQIAKEINKIVDSASDTTKVSTSRKEQLKVTVAQMLTSEQFVKSELVKKLRSAKDDNGKAYNFTEQEILFAVPKEHENYIQPNSELKLNF